MGGLRRHLELWAQSKSGLGYGVFAWALVAIVFAVASLGFILLSIFIWLAERYDPLTAALALAGFFLLAAVTAVFCCVWLRRRNIEHAETALATRRTAAWLDPVLLARAVAVGRQIGWRKAAPLLALGLLATGVAMEWGGRDKSDAQDR